MKTINKIFLSLGVAVAAMGATSCINDLDLLPVDPNQTTAATFAEDPEGYMNAVLADVYLNFSTFGANGNSVVTQFDGGMSSFTRGIFILEEVPTDEACWLSVSDVDFATLQYGVIASNNNIVGGVYSRLTINITLCNDFIHTVKEGYFHLTPDLQDKADEYVRQCRILRNICYFYLIDLFGNVPYADENTMVGSVTEQLNRADVFNLCVADLKEVIAEYGEGPQVPVYGYVGKDVAQAFLAKFYLNAEVYTGKAMWKECLAVCEDIIEAHKGTGGLHDTGLAEHYNAMFGANSSDYTHAEGCGARGSEILWPQLAHRPNLTTYAGSALLIQGFIGDKTIGDAVCSPINQYNVNSGWRCMVARRQFTDKFDWNEDMTYSPDLRTSLWCTAEHGFSPDNEVLNQDYYGQNGFLPVKYSNWNFTETGEIDENNVPTPVNDESPVPYAVVRLSEIYLSAAEAILNGVGSKDDALDYVNLIRERAGLDAWESHELTKASLQDERQRELYTENGRRTDLIRYGKWCTGYTWNWKAQVKNGADLPSHSVLYPLPVAVVDRNGYKQNPGY